QAIGMPKVIEGVVRRDDNAFVFGYVVDGVLDVLVQLCQLPVVGFGIGLVVVASVGVGRAKRRSNVGDIGLGMAGRLPGMGIVSAMMIMSMPIASTFQRINAMG